MRLVTTRKKKQIKPRELAPISKNVHLHQLSALYTKISNEMVSSKLIARIAKRLKTSRTNQHPVKISQLIKENNDGILVVVAKVLDDDEVVVCPKLTVVCLKVSRNAREKIERYGGSVYKMDQLFQIGGDLSTVKLVLGDVTARKVYRYHGSAGENGSKTLPKIISKKKDVKKRPS